MRKFQYIEDRNLRQTEDCKLAHSQEVRDLEQRETTHVKELEDYRSANTHLKKELDTLGRQCQKKCDAVDSVMKEYEIIKSGRDEL